MLHARPTEEADSVSPRYFFVLYVIGTGRKGLVLLLLKLGMRETLNVMVGPYFSLLLSGFLIISKPTFGWDSRLRFLAWSLVTIKTLPFP